MTMRVASIPAGVPFVDALAAGILALVKQSGRAATDAAAPGADDPLALARVTVMLPTRRAIRSLREAFLRQSKGMPLLLPRLMPLGELDDDAFLRESDEATPGAIDLPPAISGLRRQLLLARMVRELGRASLPTPPDEAQSARLAQALAMLLDQVQTERLDFAKLKDLAPERYASHWQQTLSFLTILTEHWPDILAAEGCLDPAERRNRLLDMQSAVWHANPPHDLVIAAGSTGSIPATADLLATVAALPQGWVVLPGLDRRISDDGWEVLPESHPQYGFARLLKRFAIARGDVTDWPTAVAGVQPQARVALIASALDPVVDDSDMPARQSRDLDAALAGVTRIDATGPQDESSIIALMMRECAETPGRTAALVTPDRDLATRVAAELRRWNIEVDDSAGRPLAVMPVGAFLRLSLAMLAEDLAPVSLLAALKHPLAAGGSDPAAFRAMTRQLERAALRGPRPGPGFAGLLAALAGHGGLADWLAGLRQVAAPLVERLASRAVSLADLLRAHVTWAETLAASDRDGGAARLWRGDDGEAMANFVAELTAASRDLPPMAGAAYPALFDALLAGRVVRPRYGAHPRLFIWGPLEARLQHADLMILGGLNEGTWPPEMAIDPWMSRPMRAAFGLPLPERRIGLSAHDFVQASAAPRVALTRALRVQGTPTVPSRWLQRLDNMLLALGHPQALDRGDRWLAWQQGLDRPEIIAPLSRPAPRPPVAARPRKLSVTAIGTWMRDPYAIYARSILGLKALDPLDADPGAAERGSFIHDALDQFLRGAVVGETADAGYRRLVEIGRAAFGPALSRPGVWAFWWPRFLRIARWVVETQIDRRAYATPLAIEGWGRLDLVGPAGKFTLVAKADRIDRLADGTLAIIDYKTGAPPSKPEMASGHEPQLPLEAAMAARGGFDGVPPNLVSELAVWQLSGGASAGKIARFEAAAELAEAAHAGLLRLIATYDDPATPYPARPRADMAPRYSDYAHLARVKEWSAGENGEGGEE